MEDEIFQKHILSRVKKLESKQFGATYEENYTPREQSKRISDGIDESHHIGKKSPEVLKQELTSHTQNYRENFTKEEMKQHQEKKKSLIDKLREATT